MVLGRVAGPAVTHAALLRTAAAELAVHLRPGFRLAAGRVRRHLGPSHQVEYLRVRPFVDGVCGNEQKTIKYNTGFFSL